MEFLGLLWNEIVIRPMTNGLLLLYELLWNNLGLAIIAFTFVVRGITYPLMARQIRQTRKMQSLQPRMKAINEKYKDNPQLRGQEVMKLYREMGINPIGCLGPLVIQIPIFVGLFWAVENVLPFTPENLAGLAGQLYGWLPIVHDVVPVNRFFLGMDLAVEAMRAQSIIAYAMVGLSGVTMYFQQKLMQQPATDPQQASQQRLMLFMFPAMFTVISFLFPMGLVIYWVSTNVIGIVMQYIMTRNDKRSPRTAGAVGAVSRLGPSLRPSIGEGEAGEQAKPDKEQSSDGEQESRPHREDGRGGDRARSARTRRRSRRSRSRRRQ